MGSMTKINSITNVSKFNKSSTDSRGRPINARQEHTALGFKAQITPMVGENCVKVAIELEKNDAIKISDDKSYPTVLIWQYESVVHVEHGKPTVVTSTTAQQNWILVVTVK